MFDRATWPYVPRTARIYVCLWQGLCRYKERQLLGVMKQRWYHVDTARIRSESVTNLASNTCRTYGQHASLVARAQRQRDTSFELEQTWRCQFHDRNCVGDVARTRHNADLCC